MWLPHRATLKRSHDRSLFLEVFLSFLLLPPPADIFALIQIVKDVGFLKNTACDLNGGIGYDSVQGE